MPSLSDTVVAATVGAVATFLGLVISKESKVSEFRQKWIDGLRIDVAKLLGEATEFHAALLGLAPKRSTVTINEITARIRLRLNLKETDHKKLFDGIVEYQQLILRQPDRPDQETVGKKTDEISDLAAEVLKDAWETVKKGESVYQLTLWIVVFSIAYIFLIHFMHRDLWFSPLR